MSITILNTSANLTGKTLLAAENSNTVTGLLTYDRDPNPPFAVSGGSAVVPNLDADKVDGLEATQLGRLASAGTWTASQTLNDSVKHIFGTGGDAELYYDGTDLILNTAAVGTGVLSLTKGQLKFPATQNASTDVNVLDDYEEGNWTPVIGGLGGTSGQSYAGGKQVGRYTKIGRLVICHYTVQLSTEGTITGTAQIQGLPFTITNTTNLIPVSSCYFDALATNWINVVALGVVNSTAASLFGTQAAAAGMTALTAADIGNTTQFSGTIIFEASA